MRWWRDRRGKGSEPEPYTVQSVDMGVTSQGRYSQGSGREVGGGGRRDGATAGVGEVGGGGGLWIPGMRFEERLLRVGFGHLSCWRPGESQSSGEARMEPGRDVRSTQLPHTLKFCQKRKQGSGRHREREVGVQAGFF